MLFYLWRKQFLQVIYRFLKYIILNLNPQTFHMFSVVVENSINYIVWATDTAQSFTHIGK